MTRCWSLLLTCLQITALASVAAELPHIDQCYHCDECVLDGNDPPQATRSLLDKHMLPSLYTSLHSNQHQQSQAHADAYAAVGQASGSRGGGSLGGSHNSGILVHSHDPDLTGSVHERSSSGDRGHSQGVAHHNAANVVSMLRHWGWLDDEDGDRPSGKAGVLDLSNSAESKGSFSLAPQRQHLAHQNQQRHLQQVQQPHPTRVVPGMRRHLHQDAESLLAAGNAVANGKFVANAGKPFKRRRRRQESSRWLDRLRQQEATAASPSTLMEQDSDESILRLFPGAVLDPTAITADMIRPPGLKSGSLPNCTRCRGCNTKLTEISDVPVNFGGTTFIHGKGATNSWLFFATPAGSTKRYIVKIFCMPYSKIHGRKIECNAPVYLERIRIMMAHWSLANECGVPNSTPRMFVSPINAIVPKDGFHVRWYGLWIEEARGITLHALWMARGQGGKGSEWMRTLLSTKVNQTQIVVQTVLDLLTAQCDRHGENIFIDAEGRLQFIDNDRALGVVTHCGADSVLLPGSRYHTLLRMGYWSQLSSFYKEHASDPNFCRGPVDPRVLMDYRCYVKDGRLGTDYPPPLEQCLRNIRMLGVDALMAKYGFQNKKAALILHRRATDLMEHGFEWTLRVGPPISAAKYRHKHQPPCCGLVVQDDITMCKDCWQPIWDFQDNSTIEDNLAIQW